MAIPDPATGAAEVQATDAAPTGRWRRLLSRDADRREREERLLDALFVPLILLALLVWLSLSANGFLERDNLTNIILQGSILGIVSLGMTFVILAGELDLSVGSGVALV